MKTSTEDKVEGKLKGAKGEIKETVGGVTGNTVVVQKYFPCTLRLEYLPFSANFSLIRMINFPNCVCFQ
jgi:hypothetical protein